MVNVGGTIGAKGGRYWEKQIDIEIVRKYLGQQGKDGKC